MTLVLAKKTAVGKLKEDIVLKIRNGELSPDMPLHSTNDLARMYNLSYVTVHKALKSLESQGFLVRKNGIGTFVSENIPAAGIRKIALPVKLEKNPFHVMMLEEISRQASERGINIVLGNGHEESEFIKRVCSESVDAIIRYPGKHEEEICREIQNAGMRCVIINDFWRAGTSPFPEVRTDTASGVAEMTTHLAKLGHKKIIFLDESEKGQRFEDLNAFRKGLWENGLEYEPGLLKYVIRNSWATVVDRELIDDLLGSGTAFIATYDFYALEIIKLMMERGIKPGKDFSIAGIDNVLQSAEEGLSTIAQPLEKIVSTALNLIENFEVDSTPKIKLPSKCIFRSSTGPPKSGTKEK